MASETLNIAIAPGQLAWLKSRQQAGGFTSASDVVRDLIRREQEAEAAALAEEFRRLDLSGSSDAEPEIKVLERVRRTKRERREAIRGS